MTTENSARQPKGIPVGGQFAATFHAEPDLALAATKPQLKLTSDFADLPPSTRPPSITGTDDSRTPVSPVN